MSDKKIFSAFISYTGTDLASHADKVSEVLRKLRVAPIDHRDSGSVGQPSVSWCFEQIEGVDILIVLVAHRYGWVPSEMEGGDGIKSITWLEVNHADKMGKIVLPYIVDPDASWPVNLVQGLHEPKILPHLAEFKQQLTRNVCGFFFDSASLDGPVSRDVPNALRKIQSRRPNQTEPKHESEEKDSTLAWHYSQTNPPSVDYRMKPEIPKRILCLEGGLFDGLVNIGYLEKIESTLRKRYSDPHFRLGSYYDLIVGNGVNSILAIELSMGKSVEEIIPIFKEVLTNYFVKKNSIFRQFFNYLSPIPLRKTLLNLYGQLSLSSDKFITGVALVVTRFDQSIPWHFLNHKDWEFYENIGKIGLEKLLEGCLAIPTYLPFVQIDTPNLGRIVIGDGSSSIGNDSSLYALSLVTNHQFPFKWRLGKNRLSLTTIGSKGQKSIKKSEEFENINIMYQLPILINALQSGAASNTEALLAGLSGSEITGISRVPILTSNRFDLIVSPDTLNDLGLNIEGNIFDSLFRDVKLQNMDIFLKIGRLAANRQIEMEDFNPTFDVTDPKM